MKFERFYTQNDDDYFCCLTTNVYSHQLFHAQVLFLEAIKDFPDLTETAAQVVTLGGQRRKGMMALEFPTKQAPPASWMLVSQLDPHK